MIEPKRWLEEGVPRDVECLVRAARAEQPDEASLRRTLAALGIALGATGAVAGAAAVGTAASAGGTAKVTAPITVGLLTKWAAFGATLGTLAVGTATIARNVPWPAPAPAVESPAQARREPTHWERTVPEHAATRPSSAASVAEPVTARPAEPGAAPPASMPLDIEHVEPAASTASGVSLGSETLAQEVHIVDRARAALAAGRAAQALEVLDEYERGFPAGRFAPEALYLRMVAFVSLGRVAQARAAAERLVTSYPNSPHSTRARIVLSKKP